MGPIGMQEMMLIFVLALLLFGPKKLPELGRMLGKGLSEFRRAKNELTSTFETHLRELEREAKVEDQAKKTADYSSPAFPYPYDESGQTETPYSAAVKSEPAVPETSPTVEISAPKVDEFAPAVPAGTVPRSNGHVTAGAPEEHSA